MSAFHRETLRMIRQNASRFVAMLFIIAVGICFVTGIGGISPKVLSSLDDYYQSAKAPDIILKSTAITGFTPDDIALIQSQSKVDQITALSMMDDADTNQRVYIYDFDGNVNHIQVLEGQLPTNETEVVVEEASKTIQSHKIGEKIEILGAERTIVGVVRNPLILSTDSDPNQMKPEQSIDDMVYFSKEYSPLHEMTVVTDLYIKLKGDRNYFASDYIPDMKKEGKVLSALFPSNHVKALTLKQVYGYAYITETMEKVDIIAMIFPLFFILVVGLLTLTNMSRLIDEGRRNIGCLTSLGYSNRRIVGKYLFFAAISTLLGATIGLSSGVYIIPNVVYYAVKSTIHLPEHMNPEVYFNLGVLSALFMLTAVLLVTLIVGLHTVNETPSRLFSPKPMKAGHKILMERITPLWRHLGFRMKSTWRNIFRFKGRFWMIVISIAGSTLLVTAGIGLYDVVGDLDAINYVSMAIIAFALILSILVLYNITTMNIGERIREIATLEVLGYQPREVYGFIYREIVIMATIGILVGIPCGAYFLHIIFKQLDFGSIWDVHVTSYIMAFVISEIFAFFVVILTHRQILRVDMNDSLKSIE